MDDFEVIDVNNKPVAAAVPAPEPVKLPQNFLLDLSRHGVTITQAYESEQQRDHYFRYYDQRGYQCRARNKVTKVTKENEAE